MRALVITFVMLVVAGAYFAVYLSAPIEGAGGDPHVNVKVDPPSGDVAAAITTNGKDAESLAAETATRKPALPADVTMMPKVSGAASAGGTPAADAMDGITVTEQLLQEPSAASQN